jgi:hypothetical protein
MDVKDITLVVLPGTQSYHKRLDQIDINPDQCPHNIQKDRESACSKTAGEEDFCEGMNNCKPCCGGW